MHRSFLILCAVLWVMMPTIAQEDGIDIYASHSILADVVANVAGDAATVTSLIPNGTDPHTFQPTSRDLTRLANADVVFVNGGLFEEGLLETIELVTENSSRSLADATNIVVASDCVAMRAFGEEDDHEEHTEETAVSTTCERHQETLSSYMTPVEIETLGQLHMLDCGDDDDNHEEDEHDHAGNCDPHVWMLPQNVMLWTLYIRDTLLEIDPENAEIYTRNAEIYLEALQELNDDFIVPMIAQIPAENRVLVTNHDTLGYFAAAYDFQIISTIIAGGGTAAEPSPAEIIAVIEQINAAGIGAIFAETTIGDGIARQIAAETGAEIYLLYSGALSDTTGEASTYIAYIQYNVQTIVDALTD